MHRNLHLDVLRTIAVSLVILSHLPTPGPDVSPAVAGIATFFHRCGAMGVDLFFVLSGFLVSGLLFREYLQRGTARVGRFLARRAFKIYPAFYVFLLATVTGRLWYGDALSATDILHEALFVQNYGAHVWSHTWSLAVEEHFYLFLATVIILLLRRSANRPFSVIPATFLVTTTLVSTARMLTYLGGGRTNEALRFPTHLQLDALFFGVVLAYYFHFKPDVFNYVRKNTLLALAISVGLIAVSQVLPEGLPSYLGGHVVSYLGFGGAVIAAVCAPPQRARWTRVAAFIGERSYSIYLWHAPMLVFASIAAAHFLGESSGFYSMSMLYIGLAYGTGLVMATVVELPALRLRDWVMSDGAQTRSGSAVATATLLS